MTKKSKESPKTVAAEKPVPESAEPIATSAPPVGNELEEQSQQLETERDQLLDRWKRAEAELDNFRKRARRDAEEQKKYQSLALARDILPALDNLGRAMDAAKQADDLEQLVQGVAMVTQQINEALARHQVLPIDAVGQPFDSELHEAFQQLPSAEHPPMTVIQELERGYKLHDRLVRPAKVIVSKAPDEAAPAEASGDQEP